MLNGRAGGARRVLPAPLRGSPLCTVGGSIWFSRCPVNPRASYPRLRSLMARPGAEWAHLVTDEGGDATMVSCLPVARNLSLRGLDVTVGGDRAVRVPAKGKAGSQEYEHQSVGGRTHRNAAPAVSGRLGSARPVTRCHGRFSRPGRPIGQENRRSSGNDLIIAKENISALIVHEGERVA